MLAGSWDHIALEAPYNNPEDCKDQGWADACAGIPTTLMPYNMGFIGWSATSDFSSVAVMTSLMKTSDYVPGWARDVATQYWQSRSEWWLDAKAK